MKAFLYFIFITLLCFLQSITAEQHSSHIQQEEAQAYVNDQVPFKKGYPPVWTVQQDETIHDVARRFLENSWQWNEAWGDQEAPQSLQPGDEVIVIKNKNRRYLHLIPITENDTGTVQTYKLVPMIQQSINKPQDRYLPYSQIAPYINQGYVFRDIDTIESLPKITINEQKSVLNRGSIIYTQDNPTFKKNTIYNVYRPSKYYYKEDENLEKNEKEILGIQADYIGRVVVKNRKDDLIELQIKDLVKNFKNGDVLQLQSKDQSDQIYSSLDIITDIPVDSFIIDTLSLLDVTGRFDTIVINGGENQNITEGMLFTAYKKDSSFPAATVIVYKTFDNVSYAIILQSNEPLERDDILNAHNTKG